MWIFFVWAITRQILGDDREAEARAHVPGPHSAPYATEGGRRFCHQVQQVLTQEAGMW